jgi:hypothetical protein
VQGNVTPFDGRRAVKREKTVGSTQSHAAVPYQKVLDGCKRPIRGLWTCGAAVHVWILSLHLHGVIARRQKFV